MGWRSAAIFLNMFTDTSWIAVSLPNVDSLKAEHLVGDVLELWLLAEILMTE